jgi:hypothetical protein
MKTIAMTLAALALAGSAVTAANAEPIFNGYVGQYQIKYANYETIVSSDGETLSGIFKVSSIFDADNNTIWYDGKDGQELTGYFTGLLVASITGTTTQTIDFTGGSVYMYLDSTPDFTANGGPTAAFVTNTNTTYNDGVLALSANFVPGIVTGDATTTFQSSITALTSPFTGKGTGYASITGGTLASILDSNSYLGGAADLLFESDVKAPTGGSKGWPVTSSDPVSGTSVPEPGTLALLGAGMLGLIGFKRRKA